jgi:hypothetical protein
VEEARMKSKENNDTIATERLVGVKVVKLLLLLLYLYLLCYDAGGRVVGWSSSAWKVEVAKGEEEGHSEQHEHVDSMVRQLEKRPWMLTEPLIERWEVKLVA